MENRSTVGMMTCWICGQGAQILIKTDLKPTLPQDCGSLPNVVCSDCESKSKENDAIWMISVKNGDVPVEGQIYDPYRTGSVCLIKKQAFRDKILPLISDDTIREQMRNMMEKGTYFYLEDSAWDAFKLPRAEATDE